MATDNGPSSYHHGDLRNAVKQAALVVLATDGPSRLSLRQVAAQAGVSHSAPRHHFGDKQQLLTELAVDGFRSLAGDMTDVLESEDSDDSRLADLLSAYVSHQREKAGYAAIMWRRDLIDMDSPELQQAAGRAFSLLYEAADATDSPLAQALGTFRLSLMLWSLGHGVATLADRLTPDLAAIVGENDPDLQSPDVLIAQFVTAALPPTRDP